MEKTKNVENLMKEIAAMPDNEAVYPGIPVNIFVQEAEDLHNWSLSDRALLKKAGLNLALLDALQPLSALVRDAQGAYIKNKDISSDKEDEWDERSELGYELQAKLLHYMRYAFRNDDALKARVDEIAEGNGHADMIQDLTNLAMLGNDHKQLLGGVGMDLSLLDQAKPLSGELADLLAIHNTAMELDNELKLYRDKAYTYLKKVVDEIRECGQFVFWRDEERAKGYASKYYREMRRKRRNKEISE